MLFNSFGYALFLPVVFTLYWITPGKFRWIILLMSSYYFYASWGPEYISVILLTTIVSYIAALLMDVRRKGKVYRKSILIISIILCAGVLFFFKYFNFFTENISLLFEKLSIPMHPTTLKLALPIGISFYIFQTISYLVDVYKGDIHAEKSFGIYAVYISFFPKVMQGPIERGKKLLPQLNAHRKFQFDQASYGLKLMAWGYFKKLVLADGLSVYVNQVYNNLSAYKGFSLVLATFFFAIQLYCDFSGYTDIALGSAKVLGINLTQNFKAPYLASSIKDFWGRWHISLSSWLRDYIYIPLGGSRVGKIRHALNIMITFLISGLWHGASWNFIVWGMFYGIFLIAERIGLDDLLHRLPPVVSRIYTLMVVVIGWVFFRADNLTKAWIYLKSMFGMNFGDYQVLSIWRLVDFEHIFFFVLAVLASTPLFKTAGNRIEEYCGIVPKQIVWSILFFCAVCFMMGSAFNPFIYFKF